MEEEDVCDDGGGHGFCGAGAEAVQAGEVLAAKLKRTKACLPSARRGDETIRDGKGGLTPKHP
jgi:hypothetical protein